MSTLEPILSSALIAAPPGAVWQLISTPGFLAESHPFCAANPVHSWPGVGSHDTIEYYNGRVVERRFTAWHEGEGYDIDVTDANGPVATATWRLSAVDAGSELTVALRLAAPSGVPGWLRWAPQLVVGPVLRRYLRDVLRGIEWRVTNGGQVRRNQFGAHPWFSSPA